MSDLRPNPDDLFLSPYYVRKGFFDIGGKLWPGSIRDQMIRAQLLVDRAIISGLLQAEQHILIVGAGAAGVTAALWAASAHHRFQLQKPINVWLIDQSSRAFSNQRNNDQRIVSPTLYDWPELHWSDLSYLGAPLHYLETTPAKLARVWQPELDKAEAGKNLVFLPGVRFELDPKATGPPWKISLPAVAGNSHFIKRKRTPPECFDLVLNCRGVAKEHSIRLVANGPPDGAKEYFPAFSFWDTDPFPNANRIWRAPSPVASRGSTVEAVQVAIVGGGDGGLQDFLRFITSGMSARLILGKLRLGLSDPRQANYVESELLAEESQWCRTYAIGGELADRQILSDWHLDYERIVQRYWQIHQEQLRNIFVTLVKFTDIHFYIGASCFSRCYGLNRFLVLLFDQYLRTELGIRLLQFGWKARTVACIDHQSDGTPANCYDKIHEVTFEKAANPTEIKLITCRVLSVRLGVADSAEWQPKAGPSRQLLPYWLRHWKPRSKWAFPQRGAESL